MIQTDAFWGCLLFFIFFFLCMRDVLLQHLLLLFRWYQRGPIYWSNWLNTHLFNSWCYENQGLIIRISPFLLQQVYLKVGVYYFSLSIVKRFSIFPLFFLLWMILDTVFFFFFLHVFTPMCWILCFDSPFIFYFPFIVKKHFVSN